MDSIYGIVLCINYYVIFIASQAINSVSYFTTLPQTKSFYAASTCMYHQRRSKSTMKSSLETRSVSDASTSSRAPFDAALSLALTLTDHQGEAKPQFRPTCTRPLMVSYHLQVDTNHAITRICIIL